MLVIQFLILSCTVIMTSGWGVLNYPEFIKHLEELEQYRDAIHHGKRVEKFKDDNQRSLYKIIKEFGKYLIKSNNSIDRKRLMKITNLMKRSFPDSELRSHKEKKNTDNQYMMYDFAIEI